MTVVTPDIVDSTGRPVSLGIVLGRGGEGIVYEVRLSTDVAAKVYHSPLSVDRSAKIQAMVGIRTAGLDTVAAWPIDLLLLRTTRQPVGLLMPRIINKKNVHHVYGPKSRLKDFPRADWRFLVRTAANIARAFAGVHDANCVIGDVNHGSIMVADDATVTLIDCDSFQVDTPNKKFLCEVGIDTFTPPELQGKPFRGAIRTPNYDNFGLAVIAFHLLFMGRHPFAGRYLGSGEMPIAKAIEECRFPYSSQHRLLKMEPPPGTPPLSFIGDEVGRLFETAFSSAAIGGGRPRAREWVSALAALEKNAKQCAVSKSHWFPANSGVCPWCQMEGQGANPLFPFVMPPGAMSGGINVESLWQALQALGDPGPAPTITVAEPSPSPEAVAVGGPNKSAGAIAFIVAVVVFIGGSALKPPLFWLFGIGAYFIYHLTLKALSKNVDVERYRKLLADAEAVAKSAQADWDRRAGSLVFYEARTNFLNIKSELEGVPKNRVAALGELKAEQRKRQLGRFLEAFGIEDAQIEGIGPSRKRLLESYGIEAADDVSTSRLRGVPGFGPKMIERLVKWRRSVEAKFVFHPSQALDPRDIAKVEQDTLALQSRLQVSLKTAHTQVIQTHAELLRTRQVMRAPLEQLLQSLGQARSDYKLVMGA